MMNINQNLMTFIQYDGKSLQIAYQLLIFLNIYISIL